MSFLFHNIRVFFFICLLPILFLFAEQEAGHSAIRNVPSFKEGANFKKNDILECRADFSVLRFLLSGNVLCYEESLV